MGRLPRIASAFAPAGGRAAAQVRLDASDNSMDRVLMGFDDRSRESRMDFLSRKLAAPSASNASGDSVASDLSSPLCNRKSLLAGSRASRGLHDCAVYHRQAQPLFD